MRAPVVGQAAGKPIFRGLGGGEQGTHGGLLIGFVAGGLWVVWGAALQRASSSGSGAVRKMVTVPGAEVGFAEEQFADVFCFNGAAAERNDGVVVLIGRVLMHGIENACDGFGFKAAEVLLAVMGEDRATERPCSAVIRESMSRKGQRRRSASRRPTVDLPAPMKPVRTMRAQWARTSGGGIGEDAGPAGPALISDSSRAGVLLVRGERGLDVLPHGRAGVVNREQQFGLLRNVFQIADQGRTLLTSLQVFLLFQGGSGFEELRQLILKLRAGCGFVD